MRMAPGPACVAKIFAGMDAHTRLLLQTGGPPPALGDSRDGELLIAGLHRFDLHRDLFHRVIERGLRRLLTGEAQFKRGVGRPPHFPISGMPGIATARADWMATALAFGRF